MAAESGPRGGRGLSASITMCSYLAAGGLVILKDSWTFLANDTIPHFTSLVLALGVGWRGVYLGDMGRIDNGRTLECSGYDWGLCR